MNWIRTTSIVVVGSFSLCIPLILLALVVGNLRSGNVLAYMIQDNTGNEQVMVIDTLRRVPLNMTPTEQNASRPVWSPDGAWLVFRSTMNPRADTRYYVTRLDRREFLWLSMPVDLTNFPIMYFEPKWTLDSQQLIFASHNTQDSLRYYLTSLNDGRLNRLNEDHPQVAYYEEVNSALVSPDGTKSFLIEYNNQTNLLHLSIIEQDVPRLLYSFEGQRSTQFLLPRWAPDSYHIAVSLWEGEVLQIYMLDTNSTPPRRITFTGGSNPVWRPKR